MIAIPVDTTNFRIKSSTLFGNAPTFSPYNRNEKTFIFKENPGYGNGIKTAKTLRSLGVNSVVYSFFGDGPLNTMHKDGIDIFYIWKEPIGLAEIIDGINKNAYIKVDTANSDSYLDHGTTAGSCECECSHE